MDLVFVQLLMLFWMYVKPIHSVNDELLCPCLREKMKNGEYESVEQMDSDLTLMFENAKCYNVPTSGISKRALRLQQILLVSRGTWILFALYAVGLGGDSPTLFLGTYPLVEFHSNPSCN